MRTLSEINLKSTEDEITKFCEDVPMMGLGSEVRQMYMEYGINLLVLKQQQKLLDEQGGYNKKQLFWSRILAVATISVAVATILLVKFS